MTLFILRLNAKTPEAAMKPLPAQGMMVDHLAALVSVKVISPPASSV